MRKGFLTITRRPGERLFIGDDIEIRVLHHKKGATRFAISAPGYSVDRPSPDEDRMDRLEAKEYMRERKMREH